MLLRSIFKILILYAVGAAILILVIMEIYFQTPAANLLPENFALFEHSVLTLPHCVPKGPRGSWLESQLESFCFFETQDSEWREMKRIAKTQHRKNLQQAALGHTDYSSNDFWQEQWEQEFSCNTEERLGRMGDGGKWVCNPAAIRSSSCLIYSIGSNDEFSFEVDVHGRLGCDVHTIDPTVAAVHLPAGSEKWLTYHSDFGVGAGGEIPHDFVALKSEGDLFTEPKVVQVTLKSPLLTLAQIIAKLHHETRPIEIFKIDIEGSEWAVLEEIFQVPNVRQVLVEFHAVQPNVHEIFLGAFKNGFLPFHKEPNIQYSEGQDLCIEYAFFESP